MQMKVDRRMRNGLLLTNSYTLGRAYSFSNGDGGGTISTPADLGARLSADDVRLDAQLRQQFRLHAPVGTRRQVDARGRHRQGARRLAGDRRRLGHLGYANRLHGQRRWSARAWQLEHAERHRNAGRPRRHRVGRALVRHVRVLRSRQQRRGATSSGAVF